MTINFQYLMKDHRVSWESLTNSFFDLDLNRQENLFELHSRWMSHLQDKADKNVEEKVKNMNVEKQFEKFYHDLFHNLEDINYLKKKSVTNVTGGEAVESSNILSQWHFGIFTRHYIKSDDLTNGGEHLDDHAFAQHPLPQAQYPPETKAKKRPVEASNNTERQSRPAPRDNAVRNQQASTHSIQPQLSTSENAKTVDLATKKLQIPANQSPLSQPVTTPLSADQPKSQSNTQSQKVIMDSADITPTAIETQKHKRKRGSGDRDEDTKRMRKGRG